MWQQALRILLFGALALPISAEFGRIRAADRQSAKRPNVLLLLSDDQRPDTIAALGNRQIETPHFDRLVRTGVCFTRAICANPICTPSRAEILSGCSGFRNGVLDFGRRLKPGIPVWPETMRRAGYQTWYVGKWHVRGRPSDYGIQETRGLFSGGGGRFWKDQKDWKGFPITGYRGWIFQSLDGKQKFPDRGVGLTADISARFADAAIEFLQRKTDQPFFLQVNFTAPHDPLIAPPGYADKYDPSALKLPQNFLPEHPFDHGNLRGRDERLMTFPRTPAQVRDVLAMYYRVVSHLDEQVGRILRALEASGKADNTLVIYTSDHGLGVGSHGLRGKQSMYEHTINVPLIIRGPGLPRGQRFRGQVYLRELFPTVCRLCSVPVPDNVEGRSFAAAMQGKEPWEPRYVFGYFRNKQRMIRGERFKLIYYPHLQRTQLFDLQEDPYELQDLSKAKAHRATREELAAALQAWRVRMRDPSLNEQPSRR